MTLQDALEKLAQAHGTEAVMAGFERLQAAVRLARKKAAQVYGPLQTSINTAMRQWYAQKAQGIPRAERDRYLEQTLRAAFPPRRIWEYACEDCHDTGLIRLHCSPQHRCNGVSTRTDFSGQQPGKHRRLCTVHAEYEHEYAVPCHCVTGLRFRPVEKSPDDELATVGKVGKDRRR